MLSFDHTSKAPPSKVILFLEIDHGETMPHVVMTWVRPDGTEIEVFRGNPTRGSKRVWVSREIAMRDLFDDGTEPRSKEWQALQGEYVLRAEAYVLDEDFSLDGRLVVYGRVHGMAGADVHRRDLWIGLLWGAPIALIYGLIATLGTTILGFVIAAVGAWLSGWVDAGIQRITEISMMIPFIPTILMVGRIYSGNLWIVLAFVVGLSILTGSVKTYRAMFIQVKNAPYIEAAKAYGASNRRIIFRYLIPHVAPVLLPQLILGIPRFVFLEATLAMIGVSDPQILTWGKMIQEGRAACTRDTTTGFFSQRFCSC